MQRCGLVELLARRDGAQCRSVGAFGELDDVVFAALSGMLELLVALQAVQCVLYTVQCQSDSTSII